MTDSHAGAIPHEFHDAFCWLQNEAFCACDRARGHFGPHSWELPVDTQVWVKRELYEAVWQAWELARDGLTIIAQEGSALARQERQLAGVILRSAGLAIPERRPS